MTRREVRWCILTRSQETKKGNPGSEKGVSPGNKICTECVQVISTGEPIVTNGNEGLHHSNLRAISGARNATRGLCGQKEDSPL
jgi:hypothetical protein